MQAHRRPDGSFEVDGAEYRIAERGGDHYDVYHLGDGAKVGSFELKGGLIVEVEPGSREATRAIASLLGTPRGILPLQ
jgi:hypothetical protein